jgi:type IV secretion system protein VirB9
MKRGLGMFAVLILAAPCVAGVEPKPGPGDPRNRVVQYDPTQVVELHGVLGYQMVIEFAPDERVENVAIGDSLGWQVTPNRAANLLFVKPMAQVPVTNMTVVTNLREYVFELGVTRRSAGAVIYTVHFDYPKTAKAADAAPAPEPPPQVVNSSYSFEGSSKVLPARIFDDGHATYFEFHPGAEYPAIFAVDAERGESVVNSHIRDGYVVVDRIERQFLIRQGSEVTRIYNDGYKEAQPGPQSPKPRKPECTNWLCL